jgi:hypothetical protein
MAGGIIAFGGGREALAVFRLSILRDSLCSHVRMRFFY